MKNKTCSLLALLSVVLLATSGCGFRKAFKAGGDSLIQNFAAIAEGAATAGTLADLAVHPEHKVLFQSAQAGLSNFVAGAGTDANSLAGLIAPLQPLVPALRGAQGAVIFAGAIKIFDAITGWEATVDSSTAVQTISRAILRGLDAALAADTNVRAAATKPAPTPPPLIPTRRIKL